MKKIVKQVGKYIQFLFVLLLLLTLACMGNEGNAVAEKMFAPVVVLLLISAVITIIVFIFGFVWQMKKELCLPECNKKKYIGKLFAEWISLFVFFLVIDSIMKRGRGWLSELVFSLFCTMGGKAFSYFWSKEEN